MCYCNRFPDLREFFSKLCLILENLVITFVVVKVNIASSWQRMGALFDKISGLY